MYDELKVRPLVAIALHTDGIPYYPYRKCLAGQVLFTRNPVLPDPHSTWSRLFRGDVRVHIDLTDESTLAELLYCTRSPDNPIHMIDPAKVGPTNLIHHLTRTLVECRCNPNRLAGWVADDCEVFAMSIGQPSPRMAKCRQRARDLLSTDLVGGGVG